MQGNHPSFQQANTFNMHPSIYKMPNNPQIQLNCFNNNMPTTIQQSMALRDLHISFQASLQNMLAWQMRNNLIRSQLIQMQKTQNDIQTPCSLEPLELLSRNTSEGPVDSVDFNANQPSSSLAGLCDSNKSMKAHLKDILYFILDNVGTASEEELNAEKLKYRNDNELTIIFEVLLSKYVSAIKTEEEMEKHIFRKAIKYMQLKSRRETKKELAQGFIRPTQANFSAFLDYISVKAGELEDYSSSAKKINQARQDNKDAVTTELIAEAFAYQEFSQGFEEFLQIMNQTLELENNKKIDKFIKHMENSFKKDLSKDIKKYKRIPWLKSWSESAKNIAYKLASSHHNRGNWCGQNKIIKKEEYVQKLEAMSDSTYSAKIEDLTQDNIQAQIAQRDLFFN